MILALQTIKNHYKIIGLGSHIEVWYGLCVHVHLPTSSGSPRVYGCYSSLGHVFPWQEVLGLQQVMYSYMIGSICVSRTVPKHSMRVSSCYSWYMYVGCMMCVVVCPTPCQATKPNVHRSAAKPASPNVYKQAPACIRSGSRTPY